MERIRTADVLAEAPSFRDLLLPQEIVKSLADAGYLRPSPVQHAAIPLARLGLDVIIQAKAGTGKTLVFAVTMTELIDRSATFPQALVLAPTREVALQAADVISEVAAGTAPPSLSIATLIGGLPTAEDERILRRKCHVLVGTPGRILSLIQRGSLVTQGISMLVLDEADKLLGSDFCDVVSQVIAAIPPKRQILALSATFTAAASEQLKSLMHKPHEVMLCAETTSLLGITHYYKNVSVSAATSAMVGGKTSVPTSSQGGYSNNRNMVDVYAVKRKALLELLSLISFHQAVVFCNSKATADTLAENLISAGHAAACLSSDKDQLQRIDVLNSLRSFGLRIVVATDVAARGIDLDRVNLVVNFDVSAAPATLMHRVGRAGRFGTHGTAISLVHGQAEINDLIRAVKIAAGGDVYPLPDQLPLGWNAAQVLDVAAAGAAGENGNQDQRHQKEQVKVISNIGIGTAINTTLPLLENENKEQIQKIQSTGGGAGSGGGGSDKATSDTCDSATVSEMISSISLWPEELSIPFQKPENNSWPLQLAELSPAAMQGNYNKIDNWKAAAATAELMTVNQIEGTSLSTSITAISHYSDIVKSIQLDLQHNIESEAEALTVLENAFNFEETAAEDSGKTIHAVIDSEQLDKSTVKEQPYEEEQQWQERQQKQRRPLGSAQVTAYTRQVAQEEQDYHRSLAQEAALLESMALAGDYTSNAADRFYYDGNNYTKLEEEEEEEEEEFDEYGYYIHSRGQKQLEKTHSEYEGAWQQYWKDHYNTFGYWPGGGKLLNSTTETVPPPPPPTPLQTPGILQIPEVSAAGYSVITPGSAAPTPTTTTAATTTTTAPAPSVALEVGGWSPTQGQPPNTASIVAACADTGGYVRVPVQILQRYLELEWRQWQNRFFGGGGGYIFDI